MRKSQPFSFASSQAIVAYSKKIVRTAVVLMAIFLTASRAYAQDLKPEAIRQIQSLMDEKASRTPAEKKISSQILYAFKTRTGQPLTTDVATLRTGVEKDADGRIKVDMDAIVTPKLLNDLKALGSEIIFSSEKFRSIVAKIPLDKVEQIAAMDAVKHINYWMTPVHGSGLTGHLDNYKTINAGDFDRIKKTPAKKTDETFFNSKNNHDFATRAHNVREQLGSALKKTGYGNKGFFSGSVTSQGDVTHKADVARTLFGTNGSGVKIGVLSDSYDTRLNGDNASDDVANGNLPGPGNPNGYTTPVTVLSDDANGSDEGRAMLQIVHDLAPGAQLYFATAFISEASFAQQILDLRAAGCDIIVDDVNYYDEGVFQDGIVAQAVNTVTASGALYFSSAGNSGNKNDGTAGVWEGDFADGGALALFPGGTMHDFSGGTLFNTITDDTGPVSLKWSDPLGASGNDYDLFLTDDAGTTILAASTDIQDGDDNPFEIFGEIPAGYRIYILKKTGAAVRALHLNTNRGQLTFNTPGVMYGHNAAASAYTVAATPVAAGFGSTGPYPNAFNSTNKIEGFSSDGPRRMFFNPNGTEITPGNVLFGTNGGVLLQKPDITAADGVVTTLPSGGLNPFFGTSAAAPHAGAIAALIKSKLPALTPAQIRTAIISSAIDIEELGVDRDAGAGIIMAYEALTAAGATQCNLPTITAPTITQTGCPSPTTGTIVVNATGSGTIEYSLNEGPYQTSNTFSGLATGNYRIRARIQGEEAGCITTYSGNPVAINPANTNTSTISYTGPAVAIPDGNAAGVNIPLVVGGIGNLVGDLNFRLDAVNPATCSAAIGNTSASVTHSWVGDLVFKLTSPEGTTVTLINRPGGVSNNGNNFCTALLDDQGGFPSIQNVTIAQAPITGNFSPANPLSAFNGEDPNGTWILNVSDLEQTDAGVMRQFSLIINAGIPCPGQPALLTSHVIGNIHACAGTASVNPALQRFNVSGYILTSDVTVTAPADFEISTLPNSGFGSSLTLTQTGGTLRDTTIYVRSAATAPAGSVSGNVTVASTGFTTINVAVNATITAVAVMSAPTVTQILCGSHDGSIVVNATGAGILEYSINGGATWSTSNTFNNLDAGSYNVAARIQGGDPVCFVSYSGNPVVIDPASTTIVYSDPTVTQTACPSPVTGTIVVNATAVGPLEYSLNDAPYQSSNTFSGLAPGNYYIKARLQASHVCVEAYPGNPVVINEPASTIVFTSPGVTQPVCPSPLTGTIVVNATGAGALEYSLNDGPYQPSNTFSGLVPGNYTIKARLQSSHTCEELYSGNPVVINEPASTVVFTTPTVTQIACPSPLTGTIIINATGAGTLEYSLNDGPYQSSNTFSGLAPGNYNITARLAGTGASCTASYSGNPVVINYPNAVVSTTSYTGPAVAIPDGNTAGVNIPLVVSGVGNTINDLNFRLDADPAGACDAVIGNTFASVTHSWVGDLVFTLTSPHGTTVTLINQILNGANSGNNFCTVTLDDDGGFPSIQNVTTAQAPVTGNFSPNSPLSAFDGEDPNGTWILNVADVALTDAGTLRRFSLVLSATTPCLVINDVTHDEGNSGPTTYSFTVNLSSPAPAGGVKFDIATADNTATTANNDYVARSLTNQTIPEGSSTYTFDVVVNGDFNIEPTESFFVNVTNVTGATVSDGQGAGTITNDEAPATTSLTLVSNTNSSCTNVAASFTATLTQITAPVGPIAGQSVTFTLTNPGTLTTTLTATTNAAGQATVTFGPGSFTTAGVYTVQASFIGTALYQSSTSPVVTYVAGTAPAFSICPSNQSVNAQSNSCSNIVNYTATATGTPAPTITYAFTGATTGTGNGTGSGSSFNIGVTTVTLTATTGCGNAATCTFTIKVIDAQAPSITCPANITQNNDPNQCGAVVTYAATANDNCPGATVQVMAGLPSGSVFILGTSTVSLMAVEGTGNTAVYNFEKLNPGTIHGQDNWKVNGSGTTPPPSTINKVVNTATSGAYTGSKAFFADIVSPNSRSFSSRVNDANFSLPTVTNTDVVVVEFDHRRAFWGDELSFGFDLNNDGDLDDANERTFGYFEASNGEEMRLDGFNSAILASTTGAGVGVWKKIRLTANLSANGGAGSISFSYMDLTNNGPWVSPAGMQNINMGLNPTAINGQNAANINGMWLYHEAGEASYLDNISFSARKTANCSFTVTVADAQPPTINCPANITVNNTNNQCGAVVTYAATATDNCPGTPTINYSPASGSFFPAGTTTVTATAMDAAGNTSSCTFTVTVTDAQNPSITCPANITRNNDANQCGAVVTYAATASDNCPGVSVSYSPSSGSFFPVGTTTVTATATDAAGHTASCTFTVTVVDAQNPSITCPANITVNNVTNQCGAVVTYAATASDNCPGVSVNYNPASGSFFPAGTTTVTATATDAVGHTATCTFTVTVVDAQNPTITCPANITTNNDPNQCGAVVTYAATASDNCPGVSVSYSPASGSFFPAGTTTVTATATDAAGHTASCTFTVTVVDTQNPTITCPANITRNNDANQCGAIVTYAATASDNCPGVSVSYSPASGSFFPVGTTTVTATATDAVGHTASCTFTVTVVDAQNPSITCPANITVNSPTGQCGAVVTYTATASDNCPGVSISYSPASGSFFPVGTTTVTATATDAAGRTATCTFTVKVIDAQNPTITCPANITVDNSPGLCGAFVSFAATANDNCPGVSVTYTKASGSFFAIGTTTVTATATDAGGRTATCTFTVKVVDTQAPTLICPANITETITSGCSKRLTPPNPTVNDNCGLAKLTWCMTGANSGNSSSSGINYVGNKTFNAGVTTITYTATDIYGNTSECSFTVSVLETVLPNITCPPNKTVGTDYGYCFWSHVNLGTPNVSDNCGVLCVTNNAPDTFQLGTTIVTWTVTDNSGNTRSCNQTITVLDKQNPSVTCPANIYQNAGASCITTVTAPDPTYYDNCTIDKLTWKMTGATTGSSPGTGVNFVGTQNYNVGTTTITYTIKDAAGNSWSCSFAVTITDNTKPTITCPANIVQSAVANACNRSITTLDPIYSDNCSVTKLTWYTEGATNISSPTSGINKVGTKTFNVGVTTVTYTAYDPWGNSKQCTFTVTVTDNQPPVATCPGAQTLCKKSNNTYTIPTLTSNDNCSIASITYQITGVTSRSGTGSNASGLFNLGLSTITWTVTDASGNTATCSTNVTIVPAGTCRLASTDPPETDPKEPEVKALSKGKLDIIVNDRLGVTAYPNPTEYYFNVKVTSQSKETVEIKMYDGLGKVVQMKRGAADQTYRFGDGVAGGIYVIEVRQGGQIATVKVMKE